MLRRAARDLLLLVAHDFSDNSEIALGYALALARKFQAELHLLHAIPEPSREPELAWAGGVTDSLYHDAARALHRAIPVGAGSCCGGVTTVVRWGKPFRETLAYAKDNEVDLICMGAHGTGFGANTLFGSNADRVLRQATCPVLIARPLKTIPGEYIESE